MVAIGNNSIGTSRTAVRIQTIPRACSRQRERERVESPHNIIHIYVIRYEIPNVIEPRPARHPSWA